MEGGMSYKRFFIIFLALIIFAALFSLPVTAAGGRYTKYELSVGDTFTYIDNPTDTDYDIAPVHSYIDSISQPLLYDFGFRDQYFYSNGIYFRNGNCAMVSEFSGYGTSTNNNLLSTYSYFTVQFFVAIKSPSVDNRIEKVKFNNALTSHASGDTSQFLDPNVEYITLDDIRVGVYTYGFDLNSFDNLPSNMTVNGMFATNELFIYPRLISSAASGCTVYLSNINIKLYTTADVVVNGFEDVQDAIDKSTQDTIDAMRDMLTVPSTPHAPNTPAQDFNQDALEHDRLVNDVTNTLPEFDKSIFSDRLPNLDGSFDFIGNLFTRVVDLSYGSLLYWILTFGIAVTIIGRTVS